MFDVLVVGARCAGAATAMLLARRGYRVMMLDKDPRGSDMAHSTHFVQAIAVSKMRQWGLLAALEASCPGFDTYSLDFGVAVVRGTPPAIDGDARAFCPRRQALDAILVAGAETAGVEYLPNTRFIDVIRANDAVTGVRVMAADGRESALKARLLVGADGPGSAVAKAVGAEHYREAPAQQVTMWGYWSGIETDQLALIFKPGGAVYCGPTSGGDSLIGVNWIMRDFKALRSRIEQSYYATIAELAPTLSAELDGSRLSTPLRIGSTRNFLRVPYGLGWVLVGDAGHKKDPCTAQGITDAFIDAAECAAVIDRGLCGDVALMDGLATWHQARDARLMPLHAMTLQMARFAEPTAAETALYRALENNPAATTSFLGLITGSTDPEQFFSPDNLSCIMGG